MLLGNGPFDSPAAAFREGNSPPLASAVQLCHG